MIPDSITNGIQQQPFVDMISNYADIDATKVQAYEVHLRGANTRQSQNLDMLYWLIWNSLSEEGQSTVEKWSSRYADDQDTTFRRGLSLLTTIIDLKTISTVATVDRERLRITQLAEYAASVDGDILKIHEEVNDATKKLSAYGHTYAERDLLLILWEAYERVTCRRFREWLRLRKDSHENGGTVQTAASLMVITQRQYETLKQKEEWNVDSVNDVPYLLAQQAEMRKQVNSLKKELKTAKKGSDTKSDKSKATKDKKVPLSDAVIAERYVFKRGRKAPEWLKKHTNAERNAKRWFNGNRYEWDSETSKWIIERDANLPKWYQRLQESKKSPAKTPKRDQKTKLESPKKRGKKTPVSAYEAVRQATKEQADGDSSSDTESE